MPKILVLLGSYLPGYKSGGPIRTIANLVEALGDQYSFYILTRDRDSGDQAAYAGIVANSWSRVGRAQVYYAAPGTLTLRALRQLCAEVAPDALYLNSFFSPLTIKMLLLRRLGRLPPAPAILAPRGQFAPGALGLKSPKKRAFLTVARAAGLTRGLIWQASSRLEREEIARTIGSSEHIHVASNLTVFAGAGLDGPPPKRPGAASFVFLSRVSPKKNLRFALERLACLTGEVRFEIYGPASDPDYWQQCAALIAALPPNVQARLHGPVAHHGVAPALAQAHFFLLPTLGENYGHAIVEALLTGLPAVISNCTPWLELARRHAGWDLPLEDPAGWDAVLRHCVAMPESQYRPLSEAARRFGQEVTQTPQTVHATNALFRLAIDAAGGRPL